MSEANIVLPALTSAQVAILWFILASAVVGLLYGGILVRTVLAANPGPKSMTDVSDAVQEGAMAYLKRQVSTMSIFVAIIFIVLFLMYRNVYHDLWLSLGISVAFLLGVCASYLAGFIGMWLAVRGNVRSANAALTSFKDAMELAFKAGGVSGMATVGLGLLGATIIFLVYQQDAMRCWSGLASADRWPRSLCASAAASTPRRPTSAATWSARSKRESRKTILATPRLSRTMWATMLAIAPEWRPTFSSRTKSPWSPRSS